MATENGFHDLKHLKSDEREEIEDKYECFKARSRKMCRDHDVCKWKIIGKNKRGKNRWGCAAHDFAKEAEIEAVVAEIKGELKNKSYD